MDARLSLAFALPLVLAACSSSPSRPETPTGIPGQKIFEQLIDQPAVTDTIIRNEDRITYMVAPTVEKPWLARFTASCTEARGSMFYNTGAGMRPFTDRYDSVSLPQPQLLVLQQSEQLRQACAYRPAPDWRALDTGEGQDWLVIDRNSAVHESGLLKVWTGTRLAQARVGKDRTLIDQLQERLAIDCSQQTMKRLSLITLTEHSAFGVQVDQQGQRVPVTQGTREQRRLVETACKGPDAWTRLARAPERKPLPPQLDTPTAAPAVVAAIQALDLPEPRLTLQGLEYRYDTLMLNGMKIKDVQRDDVLTRDPQSGQLLVRPTDSVLGTKLLLTFRGLFDLANRTFDREHGGQVEDSLHITGLAFEGDWQRLPENGKVAYSKTQTNDAKPFTTTISCEIGAARPASEINPALQGNAKRLTCGNVKSVLRERERFNYLEDYGVFVQESQTGVLGQWTWRVQSVR